MQCYLADARQREREREIIRRSARYTPEARARKTCVFLEDLITATAMTEYLNLVSLLYASFN